MTEVVDKTLIERLILEHSDRLELEINKKARADAWKFYYRVRVDSVVRPFAVCKVCFRVLHCDSRSGTASLLRHPCNPLSERSPVNRGIKLSAKLALPGDAAAAAAAVAAAKAKTKVQQQQQQHAPPPTSEDDLVLGRGRRSPSCTTTTTTVTTTAAALITSGLHSSTHSTPVTASTTTPTSSSGGSRKRKATSNNNASLNTTSSSSGSSSSTSMTAVPSPGFPLDLRFLQIPQLVAAAAAHPLSALNLANTWNLDHHLGIQLQQHIQQQQQRQLQLQHEQLSKQQQHQQQLKHKQHQFQDGDDDGGKRCRRQNGTALPEEEKGLEGDLHLEHEASSSSSCRIRVKKERADTSALLHDGVGGTCDEGVPLHGLLPPNAGVVDDLGPARCHTPMQDNGPGDGGGGGGDDGGGNGSVGGVSKEIVQQLVQNGSHRVNLADKDAGGSYYISDVWSRFYVVYVDGALRPFAACRTCLKVVTYTKYSGTGGLLRHRCSPTDLRAKHKEGDLPHESPNEPREGDDGRRSPDSEDVAPMGLDSGYPLTWSPGSSPSSHQSPLSLTLRRSHVKDEPDGDERETRVPDGPEEPPLAPTAALEGVARAVLRYMCHDLLPPSTVDTSAFQRFVWSVLNLGAAHGTFREEDEGPLPAGSHLLNSFLGPLATESRSCIASSVAQQTHLCLSVHVHRKSADEKVSASILAAAMHFISSKFELKSYSVGARRLAPSETPEDALHALLVDFLQDDLAAASLRERHVTLVGDGEVAVDVAAVAAAGAVQCVYHAAQSVLGELPQLQPYRQLCEEVSSTLSFVGECGGAAARRLVGCGLALQEVCRWDNLLHALAFITAHHDELGVVLLSGEGSGVMLRDRESYIEVCEFFGAVRRCLQTVRDRSRPTLNQAVLCRAKLLQLCAAPAAFPPLQQLKAHLSDRLAAKLALTRLHHVAMFLDPRCKSLKVLSGSEKAEVHRHVLDMMKSVAVTEANSGVLNLTNKSRKVDSIDSTIHGGGGEGNAGIGNGGGGSASPQSGSGGRSAEEVHPFSEYMDNPAPDTSVSDSEEIMAYVNMKVHLDDDDILAWWSSPSASGLPTLRLLARKVLAVPATCAYAHAICSDARKAYGQMGLSDSAHLSSVLHIKYNTS